MRKFAVFALVCALAPSVHALPFTMTVTNADSTWTTNAGLISHGVNVNSFTATLTFDNGGTSAANQAIDFNDITGMTFSSGSLTFALTSSSPGWGPAGIMNGSTIVTDSSGFLIAGPGPTAFFPGVTANAGADGISGSSVPWLQFSGYDYPTIGGRLGIRLSDGSGGYELGGFDATAPRITRAAFVGAAVVPEPATLALLGLGLAGIAAARRRKQ